jgi:RNA polymerase sigma-54 factor
MVGIKQEFRQSQQLVMTQQLQQSIKLLQLSTAELQEYIDQEIEKNPLLTHEDGEDGAGGASASDGAQDSATNQDTEPSSPSGDAQDTFQVAESTTYSESTTDDRAFEEPSYSAGAADASGGSFSGDGEGRSLEETLSSATNLRSHLNAQISVDITEPAEQFIALSLVDQLDDAGYLREDVVQIAAQLGATEDAIAQVIAKCQGLEPTGVFARNLEECLRLQLAEMDRLDPVMEILLENLDMLGRGDREKLRRLCEADEEDFAQMLDDIRRCNPKPASGFVQDDVHAVIPDVVVRRGNDSWLIELNSEALPRVLVNQHYATQVSDKADKEAKKYMNEQLANANWLVKALDQRANTILKVAEAIVTQQDMFLMHGIRFLKPLVLKDIAAAVEMHESTISRVTTNKFMATPRGTLEMKFFFTSSIQGATGNTDFSSKTVQYYIKELIDNETVENVLSDDAIVKALKGRNIDVARRTVTKYREAMHIPSSVIRRRMLKGQAIR